MTTKPKWATGRLYLNTSHGIAAVPDAMIYGHLALRRDIDAGPERYIVTHRHTGLAVVRLKGCTQRAAKALVESLYVIADWGYARSDDMLRHQPNLREEFAAWVEEHSALIEPPDLEAAAAETTPEDTRRRSEDIARMTRDDEALTKGG